jgi:voltage-gated potassium channel
MVVAVGSLPLLLLELERHVLPGHDRVFLDLVNLAVLAVFAVDDVVELAVVEGRRVASFFDALWWSTCTLTTVGYGDVYPVTGVGRMVGVLTMVVGVSAFAVVTAKLAEALVRPAEAGQGGSHADRGR